MTWRANALVLALVLAGCAAKPTAPPTHMVIETAPGVYFIREGQVDPATGCVHYPKVDGRDNFPEGKAQTLCPGGAQ